MPRLRLGYACLNLTLGNAGRTSRTCRLANATPRRLEELSRANLDGLLTVLRWNAEHDIRVFRISSDTIPLASHPRAQWPWREVLAAPLARIGRFARRRGLRLSMHPGQFAVLNAPRASIVGASIEELRYHADFLDLLGSPAAHKIVLHVGGAYGNRGAALRRFRRRFADLPENVRARLVVENDEQSFGATHVLELTGELGIPMVLDDLHHRAFACAYPDAALVEEACGTWRRKDGPPKLHYSAQKPGGRPGAHADEVDVRDFERFLAVLPSRNLDVMLEAKAKERALIVLRHDLSRNRHARRLLRI